MAAYNVLKSLNKEQVWMLKDRFTDRIKEGMKAKAWEVLNRYENFFKHADRDPDGILDFNPDATEISLWEACHVYRELTGESPTAMVTYNIWFKRKYENLFTFTPDEAEKNRNSDEFFEGMGRKEYHKLMTTTLNELNT